MGESTQLCVRTELSVERGAIANHDFKGRFVCIVGCFRPFSTSFQSYHPVSSHTRDPWVNHPSCAIDLPEHVVAEEAIARYALKCRFVCMVGDLILEAKLLHD